MNLLLVEDEKELNSAIKKILVHNGYEVDSAFDGEEALDKLSFNKYDTVILDVMMPKLDGISVVKHMRLIGNSTPVLMLTAKAEIDDKVAGLDAGADDYLTKPFSMRELLARIRALARRTSQPEENVEIDNLSLDRNNYELISKGKVHLTKTEYKIIELLMKNLHKLSSTEEIMQGVWEYESDAEINVVWVYISSLRKKLEVIDAPYIIKAERGQGYHLESKDV